jgi:hypothetical protein
MTDFTIFFLGLCISILLGAGILAIYAVPFVYQARQEGRHVPDSLEKIIK